MRRQRRRDPGIRHGFPESDLGHRSHDLTSLLATGINPIPISNYGEDVAITPDQKFLLVSDGGAFQPISVVDIVGRVEIHAVQLPGATNSVDVSSDGSVLATTLDGYVNRLTIDGSGNLTPTGSACWWVWR